MSFPTDELRQIAKSYGLPLVDGAAGEIERLQEEIKTCVWRCAYCGEEITCEPFEAATLMIAHVATCEHHPEHSLAGEVERLREFIELRIANCKYIKHSAGYHGRRIALEAKKLLAEPDYFPGPRKAAEAEGGECDGNLS